MAGLMAARVLSDHFERVTVVERDRFPAEPAPRKGVPQSRHVHALLKRGRVTLERLFPGIQEELVAAGAPSLDMAADIAWLTPAGWGIRFPSDLTFIPSSRELLEWSVRRRLAAFANVCFLEGCEIVGLLPDAQATCVAGVRIHPRNGSDGRNGARLLYADLVIDASGRGSRAPKWLEALGYPRPQETTVDPHLGYASRVYRRPPGFRADWRMIFLQAAPPTFTRGGLLLPIEGDRWMVTLSGRGRDYPPTDEAGFMDFARSLRSPLLYESIKDAEPLTPIVGYRATENRRRHYEKLSRQPEGFLVVGDAACAFNPVYAQGMTTGALGAEVLDECLRKQRQRRPDGDLTGLARGFQEKLAKVNKAPWTLATGEDFRVRGVEGGTPNAVTRLMHRYIDQVLLLGTKDASVRLVLLETFNLLKPPPALFASAIPLKVLREAARLGTEEAAATRDKMPEVA